MANTYVNKVQLADGTSLIDISDTTATADKILQGYTAYGANGQKLTGTASGQSLLITDTEDEHGGIIRTITGKVVQLQTKTITPTSSQQVVDPDTGYDGFSQVTVNAASGSNLQTKSKSYTPTATAQSETVTADNGYDGLSSVSVSVGAIPQGDYDIGLVRTSFYTEGSVRKWKASAEMDVWNGWLPSGTYTSQDIVRNAVPSNLTVTPTTYVQSVGGANYMMEGEVTVSAVPVMTLPVSLSDDPVGTEKGRIFPITDNTTYLNIPAGYNETAQHYTIRALMVGNKTITANGTYMADDDDLDGYDTVTVSLPNMTLPTSASASATSGYASKATISRSTSDQYINIPTGYNSAGAYYKINAVANGSATPAASISGSSATVSTGTNTITLSKTVSNTPQVSAGYVSSGTAGNTSVSLTASVTTQAAKTVTPTKSSQTAVASGTYTTGAITVGAIPAAYQDVTGVTAAAGDVVSGKDIVNSSGTVVHGSLVINKYYTGSSAPSASLGSNGDIYFQS